MGSYDSVGFKYTIRVLTGNQVVSREEALRQIDEGTDVGRSLYNLAEHVYDLRLMEKR